VNLAALNDAKWALEPASRREALWSRRATEIATIAAARIQVEYTDEPVAMANTGVGTSTGASAGAGAAAAPATSSAYSEAELNGRQTGSVEWRQARGELGGRGNGSGGAASSGGGSSGAK
jgi:uncharacterized membrane protein YgcG